MSKAVALTLRGFDIDHDIVTGLFLGQAALTLLQEDIELELRGGVYTPSCLGQGFVDRCHDAGFMMSVKMLKD